MKPADPCLVHERFAEIVNRVRATEIVPFPPLTEIEREANRRARRQRQQSWGHGRPPRAGAAPAPSHPSSPSASSAR
jgi:hypothetical protein